MLMPPPMVPAPITPTCLISRSATSAPISAILPAARSPKKRVAQRLRFGRLDQHGEGLALGLDAPVEGQLHRRFDRIQAFQRRRIVGRCRGDGGAREAEEAFGIGMLDLPVAHLAASAPAAAASLATAMAACTRRLRPRDRTAASPPACPPATGVPDTIMFTAVSSPTARGKPLGAAGARQQAQLHFRQTDLRALVGDAMMHAQRQFQPAAQGQALDRRDHRLGAALECGDHRGQRGLHARFGLVELADVGAAGKRACAAGDHDGLHRRIVQRPRQCFQQSAARGQAQAIDRRVVAG